MAQSCQSDMLPPWNEVPIQSNNVLLGGCQLLIEGSCAYHTMANEMDRNQKSTNKADSFFPIRDCEDLDLWACVQLYVTHRYQLRCERGQWWTVL